jgi:hypothetical protein
LYCAYDEAGNLTAYYQFSAAELVVEESGLMTLTATIEGQQHVMTFNGTPNIDNIIDIPDA